jgi:hypothetical protein
MEHSCQQHSVHTERVHRAVVDAHAHPSEYSRWAPAVGQANTVSAATLLTAASVTCDERVGAGRARGESVSWTGGRCSTLLDATATLHDVQATEPREAVLTVLTPSLDPARLSLNERAARRCGRGKTLAAHGAWRELPSLSGAIKCLPGGCCMSLCAGTGPSHDEQACCAIDAALALAQPWCQNTNDGHQPLQPLAARPSRVCPTWAWAA